VQCVPRPKKKKKQTTSQKEKKKMKNFWKSLTLGASALALAISASMAQDSGALIDALVKKGVLSDQEAEEIRADLTRDFATTSAGKLNIASHITQLKLYGDARVRFQYDQQKRSNTNVGGGPIIQDQQRNRLRLRLGADYAFTDSFKAGIGIETEAANDSANTTLGTAGAFSKNGDLNVSLLWLQYEKAFGMDWLSLTGGKQRLGHKFSSYSWDTDINPEGGMASLGKFNMDSFYVSSTHGAYIYNEQRENTFVSAGATDRDNNDTWLFINQVTFGFSPSKAWVFEATPGFVNYISSESQVTGGVTGQTYVRPENLRVLTLNLDFKHPLPWELKGRAYGEYGYNLEAKSRASTLATSPTTGQEGNGQFASLGYVIGENKKKGDWSIDGSYAYYETHSWDSNLADSDFGDSRLNQHGYSAKAVYNFTDFLTGSAQWRQSWRVDDDPTTISGLTGDSAVAGETFSGTQLLQVDLVWKF
jgi:hypothetical protein